jgi:5-(aminomethyl)-3-furanmethanol phosphate kinase
MWVVKIGGSLAGDPALESWLAMLSKQGGGRVAIVPGGGRFAEHVRAAQTTWRFSDLVAHNMAVLAMAQFAMLMRGVCQALVPAHSISAIRAVAGRGDVALWLPFELLRSHADALTSWDVTSDSLAAWLADRVGAERLVVVKSCALPREASPQACADAGIVDPCFPAFVQGARYAIDIVHKADWHRVEDELRNARGEG